MKSSAKRLEQAREHCRSNAPVRDPLEGVSANGTIATGARRDRLPAVFEPVLLEATRLVRESEPNASLYLYGSVATGQACVPRSDVDLLSIDVRLEVSTAVSLVLSERFASLCRAVEVAAAKGSGFEGGSDETYGNRVFLRHYCVHISGPRWHESLPGFPADARAARGFNGDIALHAQRWRRDLEAGADPVALSRRIARKTLLAVAGLVSVHDHTWTTDRASSARRWAEIQPELTDALDALVRWAEGADAPTGSELTRILAGPVSDLVASFETRVGLWR